MGKTNINENPPVRHCARFSTRVGISGLVNHEIAPESRRLILDRDRWIRGKWRREAKFFEKNYLEFLREGLESLLI